jgi:hypothetical protein
MEMKHVVASSCELPAELNLKRMPRIVMDHHSHRVHDLREREAR